MSTSIRCRKLASTIMAVISLSLLGHGCMNKDETKGASRTFVRTIDSDPESLDPHKFRSVQAGSILRDIGEGLVSYGSKGEIVPGIATDWSVSEDGLVYTFNLRPDAKWSNGEPLTAVDLVHSYRRLFDPRTASPSASYADMILHAPSILLGETSPDNLGVSAVDTRTFVVRLSYPTPFFLQLLTSPSMFPVYEAEGRETGKDSTDIISVSNGAYILSDRLAGAMVRLYRNENYWDNDNTWFDEVLYRSLSPHAALLGFRAGEIDFTNSVATGNFEMMKRDRPNELKIAASLNIYYYGFNLTRPPFKDNPKLRQALSMALDRETIVKKVTRRGELPAYSFVPEGIDGYEPYKLSYSSMPVEKRKTIAKRLYSEAGYGPQNPARFQLRYNTMGDHETIALAIQNLWSETLGVEVELINEEFRVLISNIQERQVTEAFRLSWNGDYKDPYTFLQLFQTGNSNNLTGYSNPEFDEVLVRAQRELDPIRRSDLLREAEGLMLSEHPVIPIYFFVNKHMLASDVVGYHPSLLDIHYSKDFWRTASAESE